MQISGILSGGGFPVPFVFSAASPVSMMSSTYKISMMYWLLSVSVVMYMLWSFSHCWSYQCQGTRPCLIVFSP